MNFASDNHYGIHPRILDSLSEANAGSAMAYGGDDWTKKSEEQLSKVFEKEVRSFLVTTAPRQQPMSYPHPTAVLAMAKHIFTVMSALLRNSLQAVQKSWASTDRREKSRLR
jgi:hypothetical protein